MIEHFTYLGHCLNFATPQSRQFPKLFDIDSLNLLIGINGSGKTKMLLQAAEVLTAGARLGDLGNYGIVDDHGNRYSRDTRVRPPGYGAVYFTSLPYRRPLKLNNRLIDASRRGKNAFGATLEFVRKVGELVGRPTVLTGRVEFRPDIVEKLIFPTLLTSETVLLESYLNDDLVALRRMEATAADAGQSENRLGQKLDELFRNVNDEQTRIDDERDEGAEEEVDEEGIRVASRRRFVEQFSYSLFRHLDLNGTFHRVAALASLQQMLSAGKASQGLVKFFLSNAGMSVEEDYVQGEASRFVELRDTTLRYLVNENGDVSGIRAESDNRIDLVLDSESAYRQLRVERTAIHLQWINLSSGLLALIEQFWSLNEAVRRLSGRGIKKIVLLIDEGDAFLHLEWQRRYIDFLNTYLGEVKKEYRLQCLQVLIASHSPLLAGDVPRCMVQNLDVTPADGGFEGKTFGSALDDIILQCFRSNSIGEFAARHIRALHGRAKSGELTPSDRALIDEIGDPAIRAAVLDAGRPHGH